MKMKVTPALQPVYTIHHYLQDAKAKVPKKLPAFPMQYHPREHQVSGLNKTLAHTRFGLFDDAGTGKSLIMQAYALTYIAWGNKVVCAMPPILLDQFTSTLSENYLGSEGWATWKIIDKPPATREKWFAGWDIEGWPDILLMSYELFVKLHKLLKKKEYRVVIADEAQKLRGAESNVHAAVFNYTEKTEETALLLATGTPLHHTPIDGFAITRLINRNAYHSLEGYKRQHCNIKTYRIKKRVRGRIRHVRIEEILDFKGLEDLQKRLYRYARRVTKDQVLNLEEPTIIPIDLSLAPAHYKLYNLLADERMLELGDNRIITATEAVQLREHLLQIVCNPQHYSDKKIENRVLIETETLLDSIGPDKKVILYAHHNRTIDTLAERFEGMAPLLVYGGEKSSAAKNRRHVQAFKTDPTVKMMIAHPQSGGVGLDLQHVCHHIIFVEPTSIQGDFAQVLARVQRFGQKHAVLVYVLRVAGTVFPKMVETMLDNSDLASTVNNDHASFRKFIKGA